MIVNAACRETWRLLSMACGAGPGRDMQTLHVAVTFMDLGSTLLCHAALILYLVPRRPATRVQTKVLARIHTLIAYLVPTRGGWPACEQR